MTVTCKVLIGSGRLPAVTSSCNSCVRTPSRPISGPVCVVLMILHLWWATLPALLLQTFFLGCLSLQPWRMELKFSSGQKAVCLLNKGQAGLLTPRCERSGSPSCNTSLGWVQCWPGLLCISCGPAEKGAAVNWNLIQWHFDFVDMWLTYCVNGTQSVQSSGL